MAPFPPAPPAGVHPDPDHLFWGPTLDIYSGQPSLHLEANHQQLFEPADKIARSHADLGGFTGHYSAVLIPQLVEHLPHRQVGI